ncbi:mitochondrial potassium channel-like [Asterias amurensis]|uniref:mitochondrial potassium channel-like n=1 Tax=Asterias amurensis TaxID=7602 RepID=UPI003AB2075D
MARQFDYKKLIFMRSVRASSCGYSSVSGSGKPPVASIASKPDQPPLVAGSGSLLSKIKGDQRLHSLVNSYEDVVGIGEVKRAQEKVTQIEKYFMEVRENVKKSSQKLHNVQSDLRAVRAKLDRTPRDDAKFLEYATEEHLMIQSEKKIEEEHEAIEDMERSAFAKLSVAVRESHEKQRSQEERTKYWGVIGSIVGTIIGLLGSTMINQRRMHELRTMVSDLQKDIGQDGQLRDLQGFVDNIRGVVNGAAKQGQDLTIALDSLAQQQQDALNTQDKNIAKMLKQQEGVLLQELEGVRRFASIGSGDMTTLEEMVNNAEQKLEWEMKLSTLSTVVFIYGAFALTLPILYSIFK